MMWPVTWTARSDTRNTAGPAMSSDDRVGETTRFTYRPNTEWYWFPQLKPKEVSVLKCFDSVTDRVGTQPDIRLR